MSEQETLDALIGAMERMTDLSLANTRHLKGVIVAQSLLLLSLQELLKRVEALEECVKERKVN